MRRDGHKGQRLAIRTMEQSEGDDDDDEKKIDNRRETGNEERKIWAVNQESSGPPMRTICPQGLKQEKKRRKRHILSNI